MLQEQKVTCIMVTHNPDLECYADRVLYIEDGRVRGIHEGRLTSALAA